MLFLMRLVRGVEIAAAFIIVIAAVYVALRWIKTRRY